MANFNHCVLIGTAYDPVQHENGTGHFILAIRETNKPPVFVRCEVAIGKNIMDAGLHDLPVMVHAGLCGVTPNVERDCDPVVTVYKWEIL